MAIVTLLLAATAANAAEVVGRLGSVEVTSAEIRAYVERLTPQEQAALAKDPALLSQVVRSYLARQAVLREAAAKKWDQTPAAKAQLERVREEALFELYLQSVSRPPDGWPSAAEVKAAYEANRKGFEVPKQWRVAQIFLAAPRGDRDAEERARKRLDELGRALKAKDADFSALARTYTEERQAAARGGEIGWLSEEQMVPGIRASVLGLAKGATSEPLRLDDGWHVVKVLDVKPPSTRTLAEVQDALAAQMRADRARADRQAYLAKLLEKNPPAIDELSLPKVLARSP